MPKCLIITGRDPVNLYGGDINRLEALVKNLSKRYYVEIAVTNASTTETIRETDFRGCNVNIHKVRNSFVSKFLGILFAFFSRTPIQSGIFINPFVRKIIRSIICSNDYEIVVFHLFRTYFDCSGFYGGRLHVDMCDAQSRTYDKQRRAQSMNIFMRALFSFEYFQTKKMETRLLTNENLTVSLINEADLKYLKTENKFVKDVFILPNIFKIRKTVKRSKVSNKIAIVGNFHANHNKAMVESLIVHNSDFLSKYPATIVGQMSPSYERSLPSSMFTIKKNPKSIHEHLFDCDYGLCFLPFGAGFQTKLIDYANAGLLPIVSLDVALGAGLVDHKSCIVLENLCNLPQKLFLSDQQKAVIVDEFQESLIRLSIKSNHNWDEFVYGA